MNTKDLDKKRQMAHLAIYADNYVIDYYPKYHHKGVWSANHGLADNTRRELWGSICRLYTTCGGGCDVESKYF